MIIEKLNKLYKEVTNDEDLAYNRAISDAINIINNNWILVKEDLPKKIRILFS